MKELKTPITLRGDHYYCPLPISLDTYWGMCFDCLHCYFRGMNHVWGTETRVADPNRIAKTLFNGMNNKNPKSALAHALAKKKTIRWGNKCDPFPPEEATHRLAPDIFNIFLDLQWSFVIQTMNTEMLLTFSQEVKDCATRGLVTIMPVVSPGLEKDWEIFERKRTTNPLDRIKDASYFQNALDVPVGINGEPFIPGFHTVQDFEDTLKLLKHYGIRRYNTYNFHFTPFVAKNLVTVPGVDVERIWFENQDTQWRVTLRSLLDLAKKYDILLGCPDFVNTGMDWTEKANTCCGIDVPNPCTFNTHHWKKYQQLGLEPAAIVDATFDGVGTVVDGLDIIHGKTKSMYTLKDAEDVSAPAASKKGGFFG